jgi:hypothetical protein
MIAMVALSRWIYLAALRLTDLCVDRFLGRWPRLLHCSPSARLTSPYFKVESLIRSLPLSVLTPDANQAPG